MGAGRDICSEGASGESRGELAFRLGDEERTLKSGAGGAGSLVGSGARSGCSRLGEARTGASREGRWNSAERWSA